ncbi:MAG TPA: DUF2232 domain-containing protein, partial [Gemmatimonadales bacterium]
GREWFWAVASGTLLALSLRGGGMAEGFIRATGVFAAGTFVALSVWSERALFRRAAVAAGVGLLVAVTLSSLLGAGWSAVERELERALREAFLAQARLAEASGFGAGVTEALREMGRGAGDTAAFYPALLALMAIAGAVLGWRWFRLIVQRPGGAPDVPFSEFRFSDQAVWIVVAALAATLFLPEESVPVLGAPLAAWARNLLAVMVALYVARGLAIFAATARRVPRRIVTVLALVGVLLWPFAAGGLLMLGLADSWVDFRRRLASPPTGGMER